MAITLGMVIEALRRVIGCRGAAAATGATLLGRRATLGAPAGRPAAASALTFAVSSRWKESVEVSSLVELGFGI